MKGFANRLGKLEEVLNPKRERIFTDEELEKHFFGFIERLKTRTNTEGAGIDLYLKMFEIEKEQAKKEERQLETWWNVIILNTSDPKDYEWSQRVRGNGIPPLTEEHKKRLKELFVELGHPMAEIM